MFVCQTLGFIFGLLGLVNKMPNLSSWDFILDFISARAGIIQQTETSGVVIRHGLGSWALGFYLEDTFGMCFSGPGILSLTYSFWSLVGLSQAFGFYLQNPLLFILHCFLPWGQARDSIQGPLVSDQLDSIPNLGLNPWLQAKVHKQRVCFSVDISVCTRVCVYKLLCVKGSLCKSFCV